MKSKSIRQNHRNIEQERWAFNLSTDRLFVLGVTAKAKYAALRMADGQLRFLSL